MKEDLRENYIERRFSVEIDAPGDVSVSDLEYWLNKSFA